MQITPEDIKITVERPDKMMDCGHCHSCFYLKKIEGKGEMIVMAKQDGENSMNVECFGWMQPVEYKEGT